MRSGRALGACAAVVAAAGLWLPPAGAQPVLPSVGVGMAHANGSLGYFTEHVAAGGSVSDAAVVRNTTSRAVTFLVDSVDGLTATSTGAVYAARAARPSEAGAWVSPAVHRITVAPMTASTIPFAVHVPTTAVPGDHLAGLAFQDASNGHATRGRLSVVTVSRIVLGVLVQVSGPAQRSMTAHGCSLVPIPGTDLAGVRVLIANTGLRLVHPKLAVSLSRGTGQVQTVVRQLDTVLPRDSIAYVLPWPDTLPPGSYEARVTLTAPQMATVSYRCGSHLAATLAGASTPRTSSGETVSGSAFAPGGSSLGATGILGLTPVSEVLVASLLLLVISLAIVAVWLWRRSRRQEERLAQELSARQGGSNPSAAT